MIRPDLLATGHRRLGPWAALVHAADPHGAVRPRSRLLCAALSALASACGHALGHPDPAATEHAAAGLALLTKVDDEVIDARAFHGGRSTDRAALRAKTRAFLAPTLAAVRTGEGVGSPRVRLAAEVGRSLRALDDGPHLDALLRVVADGWAVQVEAVAVLSADPATVDDRTAARATAAISDAWLHMIARVGALGAPRDLSPAEAAAFGPWGRWIQRADGLADLAREQADGFVGTDPGRTLHRVLGAAYLPTCDRGDVDALYAALVDHDLDLALVPDDATLDALARPMATLGRVPALLRWIHGFLVDRYLAHPRCRRAPPLEAACSAR